MRTVTDAPGIVADFNYGGIVGDDGRVYLKENSVDEARRAGIELRVGESLTLCDYDGDDHGNPLWLVADGVVGWDAERGRWYMDYRASDVRWKPRQSPPPER